MPIKKNVVHVIPYEALYEGKINHILQGLHSSDFYRNAVDRSIIIGPSECGSYATQRAKFDFKVLYCAHYGLVNYPYARAFAEIEHKFGVSIVYGTKSFSQNGATNEYPKMHKNESDCEVILIDVSFANPHPVNALKSWLFEEFSLQSDRYEHNTDFETYIKLAPAALAVLRSMNVANSQQPGVIIGHDYMGLPTALAAVMDPLGSFKTVFFANEVPAVKNVITNHPGHDTMFYNAKKLAWEKNLFFSEIFNLPEDDYKNALVSIGCNCDCVMTVSDNTADELRWFNSSFAQAHIAPVHKGIDPLQLTFADKMAGQAKLRDYCRALFGYRPDYIFTHSACTDTAGGYWRDLGILDKLDRNLNQQQKRAIFYLYDQHHKGNSQIALLKCIDDFNRYHHNIKAVLITIPAHTTTNDLNNAEYKIGLLGKQVDFSNLHIYSDLDFNLSIYEPFGQTTVEALTAGAIVVINQVVAGCITQMDKAQAELTDTTDNNLPNTIIKADYTQLSAEMFDEHFCSTSLTDMLGLKQSYRDTIEKALSSKIAQEIMQSLPNDDSQREIIFNHNHRIEAAFNWDNICKEFFLPALEKAYKQYRNRLIA